MSGTDRRAAARELLRSTGLRATPVRIGVLVHLLRAGRPVRHGDLWAKKRIRSFNRVTVYRTLLALQARQLVHAVLGPDGAWRYCAHERTPGLCAGNHPHFACSTCGGMICLHGQPMPFVEVPEGTIVEAKQLVVHGNCAECAGKHRRRLPALHARAVHCANGGSPSDQS